MGIWLPDRVPFTSTMQLVEVNLFTAEVRHAHEANLKVELELEDLESFRSEGQRAGRVREVWNVLKNTTVLDRVYCPCFSSWIFWNNNLLAKPRLDEEQELVQNGSFKSHHIYKSSDL